MPKERLPEDDQECKEVLLELELARLREDAERRFWTLVLADEISGTTSLPTNPSVPVTKQQAADAWGGSMTVKKLTTLMREGECPHKRLTRQMFIFSCDVIPGLKPAPKKKE